MIYIKCTECKKIIDINNEKYLLNFKKDQVTHIKCKLEYLRGEIEAERISYGELSELQSLAEYIDDGDMVLREWAGIPGFK